jgi:hypothetical protein
MDKARRRSTVQRGAVLASGEDAQLALGFGAQVGVIVRIQGHGLEVGDLLPVLEQQGLDLVQNLGHDLAMVGSHAHL